MSIKRQTLWNLAPQLVTALVAMFSMPLFVRYLGIEKYALFYYVTTVSGMFGFADLGLGTVVGRNISMSLSRNDLAAVRRYWGTGNLIVLPVLGVVTVAFVGLVIWIGPKWFTQLSPAHVGLFRACIVANGFGLFFSYYGTFWLAISQAYLDFKFIGLIRAVITPLQIIPSVLLAWWTANPFWVLAWSSAVGFVQLLILIWHARRHHNLGMCLGEARLACAREMSGFTAKMFVNLVEGAVFSTIDRHLLAGQFVDLRHYQATRRGRHETVHRRRIRLAAQRAREFGDLLRPLQHRPAGLHRIHLAEFAALGDVGTFTPAGQRRQIVGGHAGHRAGGILRGRGEARALAFEP